MQGELKMRCVHLILLVMLALTVGLVGQPAALAQEEPAEPGPAALAEEPVAGEPAEGEQGTAQEADISYWQVVKEHAGVPGWIIIGMSVIAFYLVMQSLWHLRRPNFVPDGLVQELNEDLSNGRLGEMMEKCRRSGSVLGHVVAGGLSEVRSGYEEMADVAEEVSEVEASRLHQRVGWLALIGAIAPMLGLTGTVLGMMGAFGTISQMETQPPPKLLAGNIQHALVTTCLGLIVAVPVLVAYAVFRNRVNTLMHEVGAAASEVIGRFKNVKVSSKPQGAATTPAPRPSGQVTIEDEEETQDEVD